MAYDKGGGVRATPTRISAHPTDYVTPGSQSTGCVTCATKRFAATVVPNSDADRLPPRRAPRPSPSSVAVTVADPLAAFGAAAAFTESIGGENTDGRFRHAVIYTV